MVTPPCSRADLHCHSAASATSKLGVQRALGLPECATPPELVYEQAKRRGMDLGVRDGVVRRLSRRFVVEDCCGVAWSPGWC